MSTKSISQIKTWIENRIARRNEELEHIARNTEHFDNVIESRNVTRMLKTHFESIYRKQYEMTQYLIILERIKAYEADKLAENVFFTQVIAELECWKSAMINNLFNKESMPSTTNIITNLCELWETEVHKKMIRDISNLLK